MRLPFKDVEPMKKHISEFSEEGDPKVIYQKTSLGNLWITDTKPVKPLNDAEGAVKNVTQH